MIHSLVAVTLLATATLCQADAPQSPTKHLLRYRFEPNAVSHFSIEEGIKMTARMGEREMVNDAVMTTYATAKIKAIDDAKATVEQQITRITAKVTGMMPLEYDSKDPEADPSKVGVPKEAIGAKVGMKISDLGKASDFTAPESLLQDVSADQLGKNISRDLITLPEQPIAIGGTWTAQRPLPLGPLGQPMAEVTSKLVSVSERFYELEQKFAFDASKFDSGAAEIESVKASAKVKIDRRTGLLFEMKMDTVVKLAGQTATTLDIRRRIQPADAQTPPAADTGK